MALTDPPRLLVTGASGQVGGELVQALSAHGMVIAPSRADLNLADPASIRAFIRNVRPRWIFNAGAYTAVDRAESEPDLAFAINAEAVRVLGEEAKIHGAAILHFSTDYVFDGQGTKPYIETDPTGPLGVYGASKLAGEEALTDSADAFLIFRTSWVYGATGKNFLRTILKLSRERGQLRIVDDQHGAPTWSCDLARMAVHVFAHCEKDAIDKQQALTDTLSAFAGIYHASGAGETTWAGFAREAIHQCATKYAEDRFAEVVPILTSEYPTPAARPANSLLSGHKLQHVFGWTMMDWQSSLAAVLDRLR